MCGTPIQGATVRGSTENSLRVENPPDLHSSFEAADTYAPDHPRGENLAEETKRPTRQRSRGLLALAGLTVLAAVLSSVVAIDHSSQTLLPGFVLSVGKNGLAQTSAPDGSSVARLSADLPLSEVVSAVFGPNGHDLVTSAGALLRLEGGRVFRTESSIPVPAGQSIAALADQDQAVITVGPRSPASSPVYVTVFGQRPVRLGDADAVAGDPLGPGAVVSVASSDGSYGVSVPDSQVALANPQVDIGVELRDLGHRAVVLDSGAQLKEALNLPPATPIQILIAPSPSGQRIALEVSSANFYSSPWDDVVIVDRHGTILGTAQGLGGRVSWAPNSEALAYPEIVAGHLDIVMWTLGGSPTPKQGPRINQASFQYLGTACLWAPTSTAVLCALDGTDRNETAPWLIATESDSRLTTYIGSILPLQWLPGPVPNPGEHHHRDQPY
jgi:hypothetical protein